MDVAVCVACGECAVILDPISGLVACEACGRINDDTPTLVSGREAQFDGGSGWQSSANYSALQGMQTYNPTQWTEKKKRLAMKSVERVTSCLRLPSDKVEDVKHLLGLFFETGYGVGRWVEISAGACAYIVIRQTNTPVTLPEVAEVLNCSVAELGRMFNRVLSTLEINLPETNASIFLERAVMSLSAFQALTKPVKRDLIKHGLLLLEYARQWSITEGRHFLPVVAAILLLLGEANQLKLAPVQISRELHTSQACMSLRSKELKDALVRFAQKLPWGQDISGKTVHRHLPFLLQYLEVTRKLKKRGPDSDPGTFYPPNKKLK